MIDDYTSAENDYYEDTKPKKSNNRTNRKFSPNYLYLISFDLKNSSTRFDLPSPNEGIFTYNLWINLVFNKLENSENKKYILCNMRPYPNCQPDSFVVDQAYKNETVTNY